jgi:SPP1 family predicted phage head-tail adaptor
MQSGDLRHRIELQSQTRTPDGGGGFVVAWAVVHTVYASIWPLKGEESLEGGRTIAAVTHRVRIRFRRGVKASMRIRDLFSGKYFSIITAPIDLGDRHEYLEMMVKETTA